MKRVAFLMTHPTQYHSPWFRSLAKRSDIEIHVYYGMIPDESQQGTGFGIRFEWDVPLLDGYSYTVLRNTGTGLLQGFRGVDTPEIETIIRSSKFDAWVINGWRTRSEWRAIRACWKARVPMFVRGDSNLLTPRPIFTRALKWILYRRWLRRFDCYLTVGILNERYYEHYGADRSRFVPVRHFVDNDWFAERADIARAESAALRRAWGVSDRALLLMFAGKFISKKQPMDAIRAIEKLTRDGGDAHLLMVGDGPLRAECEAYSSIKGLPVTFTGFLNQAAMPAAYASSDVLIVTSVRDETWGLVVNEAMASGLPAIVSDQVGCAPDLVLPGFTGAVFAAGDSKSLAEAVLPYLEDRALAVAHGWAARARVQSYSLEAAVAATVHAVERFAA